MHARLKNRWPIVFFRAIWRQTRYDVIETQQTKPRALSLYTNECTLLEVAYLKNQNRRNSDLPVYRYRRGNAFVGYRW